jgi:hypothetical protein
MFGSSRSFRSGRGTTPAPRLFSSPPILILLLSLAVAGCGGTVNVKEAFIVSDLSGGWFDAGITEGKNRLVQRDVPDSEEDERGRLVAVIEHPLQAAGRW